MPALVADIFSSFLHKHIRHHDWRFQLSTTAVKAKLHYMDTGYGHVVQHHQRSERTPTTDELTTILQQICHTTTPEPNILTCQDVRMWQIFVQFVVQQVVELL